jgi:pyridoxine 5-phosphate synthase
MLRLHVNVDHVATLRQARRASFPDPVEWALQAESAGADGITCHLRKDRRHVQDGDVGRLRERLRTALNLECSLDEDMLALAEASGADAFCLVPEQRLEITTEGGLDVLAERARVARAVERLSRAGGAVSLFVDPEPAQLEAAAGSGAPFVELHTGAYANASGAARAAELERLAAAAGFARGLGLRVNAGHGLDYANVGAVAAIAGLEELNIGFAIVARSLFVGVDAAIRGMIAALEAGRRGGR